MKISWHSSPHYSYHFQGEWLWRLSWGGRLCTSGNGRWQCLKLDLKYIILIVLDLVSQHSWVHVGVKTTENLKLIVNTCVSILHGSASIVIGLCSGPRNFNLIRCRNKKVFSSLMHPDWLWHPHSLLFSGYCGISSGDTAAKVWSWPPTSI